MAQVRQTVIGLSDLEKNIKAVIKSVSAPEMANIMLSGAEAGADSVRIHILQQGLFDKGDLLESVEAYKVNQFAAGIRVSRVYAAIHEYGGSINVPVTAKSRKFFWYMFISTGDPKWKYMALSDKDHFVVTIPARPYFRPGIDQAKFSMIAEIGDHALANIKAVL